MLDEIIGTVKDLVQKIWAFIKKIIVGILNFFAHIVSFFKDPQRLKKLKEDENIIAVTVKDNLENGNYNIVNCLFDTETEKIVDYAENALGITADELDEETQNNFAGKDMIILQ